MTRDVNAVLVDRIIMFQGFQHHIEEFQITITLFPKRKLPAGLRALRIGQSPGSRQPLRVNDDRFRPKRLVTKPRAALRIVPPCPWKTKSSGASEVFALALAL